MMYRCVIKRAIDFLFATFCIFLFLPVFATAIIATYFSSPGRIFFKQIRVGKNGTKFELFKFRTMYENPDRKLDQTRCGDPEITPIGSIMRRFKIDELPQLFNVVMGDMSLVGPRPCLPFTAEHAPDWARKRFHVVPGLTGLAQVNGNVSLSWEQRWKYDIYYIDQLEFILDVKILFKTIYVIIKGEEYFRRTK
jgi:undecaprenyl phosphate N,N'-diacetylbacillosamine 1-phosphate transferase